MRKTERDAIERGLALLGARGKPEEKKRTSLSKTEWTAIKAISGSKCVICGKNRKNCRKIRKSTH